MIGQGLGFSLMNCLFCMSGIEFNFQEMPMGGSALDLVGVPLPEETLSAAKKSDAVLLGAIGGCSSLLNYLFSLSSFSLLLNYCSALLFIGLKLQMG